MYLNKDGEISEKNLYNRPVVMIYMSVFTAIACISMMVAAHGLLKGASPLIFFLGLLLLVGCYIKTFEYLAVVKVENEGLCVKYPYIKEKIIPWDSFQEVCICYAKYKKNKGGYKILCFVKNGQKKNSKGYWNIDNPLYFHSLIKMDYTNKLMEEVREKCPLTVTDLTYIQKNN